MGTNLSQQPPTDLDVDFDLDVAFDQDVLMPDTFSRGS